MIVIYNDGFQIRRLETNKQISVGAEGDFLFPIGSRTYKRINNRNIIKVEE